MSAIETLKAVGIHITETLTKPTRAGKQPRPVWEIGGNTKPYEHLIYGMSIKAKRWKGVISCWEDPTEELAELIEENGAQSFADQQAGKQERAAYRAQKLRSRSKKHQAIADGYQQKARDISERFVGGQPIILGHHSTRGALRDREKMDANTRRSIKEDNYAEHLRDRAIAPQRVADGKHLTATYIGNRLEEAKAQLRAVFVMINGGSLGPRSEIYQPATGDRRRVLELEMSQIEEQIAYWESLLSEKGGDLYSQYNVGIGDWVLYRGTWYKVFRANPKTVSIKFFPTTVCNLVPYYEIKKVCHYKIAEEYAAKNGIDLNAQHKTSLHLSTAMSEKILEARTTPAPETRKTTEFCAKVTEGLTNFIDLTNKLAKIVKKHEYPKSS